MPGSSGLTQSMKKTIGHRGVETTTGETTYKKVQMGCGGVKQPQHGSRTFWLDPKISSEVPLWDAKRCSHSLSPFCLVDHVIGS